MGTHLPPSLLRAVMFERTDQYCQTQRQLVTETVDPAELSVQVRHLATITGPNQFILMYPVHAGHYLEQWTVFVTSKFVTV